MNSNVPSPTEARAALDAAGDARLRLAALGQCPPWRHAAFGAVMGTLITGIGLPLAWQVATFIGSMAAVVWIKRWDERRYGVFINGYRRGATLPFTLALLAVMLALMVVQIGLRREGAVPGTAFAIGFAAFLIGTGASVIWSRIFRREMEERA